jgi:23S rRNA (adenine2503-C2)-methyltransferase
MTSKNLLTLSFEDLEQVLDDLGEPRFRAKQLWQWLWQKGITDLSQATNLAKSLRAKLDREWIVALPEMHTVRESRDGTVKFLLRYEDGALIETVLIPEGERYTQCISTQLGCAMGCTFCSTGQMGFVRNLKGWEIAAQVLAARSFLKERAIEAPLKNLVFMGMGEPLLNWKEVRRSLDILHHPLGLDFSRRRVTLSTVGVRGMLEEFGRAGLGLPAISLHAPTQELRERIMPGAARLPLEELIGLLETYPLRPRERVTIEYILLGGVNDTPAHARQLVRLLSRVKCKINLIAYNPGPGIDYEAPTREAVLAFEKVLWDKGMTAVLRKSKGQDIAAACGQLKTEVDAEEA